MRWLDGITNSMGMGLSKPQEIVNEGQGSLACCSPWGRKGSDTTQQLNNNKDSSPDGRRRSMCSPPLPPKSPLKWITRGPRWRLPGEWRSDLKAAWMGEQRLRPESELRVSRAGWAPGLQTARLSRGWCTGQPHLVPSMSWARLCPLRTAGLGTSSPGIPSFIPQGTDPDRSKVASPFPAGEAEAPWEGWIQAQAGSPGHQVGHKSPGSFMKARGRCHFHELNRSIPHHSTL